MPTYEYECKSCKHEMEIVQKITEDALKKCPKCGKDTLNRLISGSGFQLKGTGWYVTDFKDKPKSSDK
jgi:putative FmdB family regulatory protein